MFLSQILPTLWICLLMPTETLAEHKEVTAGRKAHEALSAYTHFYTDDALNAYVNEIGQKLAANSDWPEIDYHFFIVDSPDINAFATSGGYVYINRGLMSYLTSEAQLAAVLSHEIAHITRHHSARQKDQHILGNVAAFVTSIALWNGDIGEAIKLENAARVSGYGREMELEADEYGATYLYRSGYDPNAIIEVLGILKDYETFSVRQARDQGRQPATYHGVFSTHPRNDQRLRDVVTQAGLLPPGEAFEGRSEYRKIVDGMVFGENDNSSRPPGHERYASKGLGVTFVYPEGWSLNAQAQTILLDSGDGIQVTLEVANPEDSSLDAEELLLNRLQLEKLKNTDRVYAAKESEKEAVLALAELEQGTSRVAAIKLGAYTYFFKSLSPSPISEEADNLAINIIKSFRRAEQVDFPPSDIKHVSFHRLAPGETFAELAQGNMLGRYTEEYLRLMNGYYPTGEPQPGTWIKMAK